jgi:hypothetical protein
MDLALFARLVEERAESWRLAGITSEFHEGPPNDKQAAWVDCATDRSMAHLIVWTSGEADLSWGYADGGEPETDHYELTSEIGLIGCLDDFTGHLLARP